MLIGPSTTGGGSANSFLSFSSSLASSLSAGILGRMPTPCASVVVASCEWTDSSAPGEENDQTILASLQAEDDRAIDGEGRSQRAAGCPGDRDLAGDALALATRCA